MLKQILPLIFLTLEQGTGQTIFHIGDTTKPVQRVTIIQSIDSVGDFIEPYTYSTTIHDTWAEAHDEFQSWQKESAGGSESVRFESIRRWHLTRFRRVYSINSHRDCWQHTKLFSRSSL